LTPLAQPEAKPTVAACRRTGVRFMGAAFDAAAATRAERDAQARSGGPKQACGRSLVLDTLLVLASHDPAETHYPACDGLMAGGKAGVSTRPWRPRLIEQQHTHVCTLVPRLQSRA